MNKFYMENELLNDVYKELHFFVSSYHISGGKFSHMVTFYLRSLLLVTWEIITCLIK